MTRAPKPFVDAPVGVAPPAGAAAREGEPGLAPAALRFPDVARMADLVQRLVSFADVPVAAAAPQVAQAALRLPDVARIGDLANLFAAASIDAAETYPRFYSLE